MRSIFQNPDDDTPRLVFADFLEENNEPDPALIRLQCEIARERPRLPRGLELQKQERGLVSKIRRTTIDPLPEGIEVRFERGFLHLVSDLTAFREVSSLPARFTSLFQSGWVEVAKVIGYIFAGFTEELAALLSHAAELDFSSALLSEDAILSVAAHYAEMQANGRVSRVSVSSAEPESL